ncbi:hypothetical protein WCE41_11790 [Luteimonas sp. MJ246]|uniref:hypothetical protein n=1 Tax=Luteimonas sp. MJ174 TaxID=3129237 RepID=UPI0031BBBD0A
MRAEVPGARTWVLGAVALWALATWALGLFGLGGRVDRLPPDPELVQALPAAIQPGDERLGPLAQYAELGDRPMFTTDRRPQPFFINPEGEEAPAEFEYVLTSVLLTPGLQVAIVQPVGGGESLRLKVGESAAGAPGWQLASMTPRSAVFDGPEGQRTLELRVFDGVGGEAPTAMSTPSAPSAPRDAPARGRLATGEGADAGDEAGNRPVVVTTSSSPAPTEVEVPAAGQAPAADASAGASPEDQVNAIRQRIEARRARQREQAQQDAQSQ